MHAAGHGAALIWVNSTIAHACVDLVPRRQRLVYGLLQNLGYLVTAPGTSEIWRKAARATPISGSTTVVDGC